MQLGEPARKKAPLFLKTFKALKTQSCYKPQKLLDYPALFLI